MRDTTISTKTSTAATGHLTFEAHTSVACLLAAYAKPGTITVDRCKIPPLLTIGRTPLSILIVNDSRMSKQHFRITEESDGFWATDLKSKNGTYLNGDRLEGRMQLRNNDVIRAGESLFVFNQDTGSVLEPLPLERLGITGDFYAGPLVREIAAASLSERHILVTGPSGAGKELVASGLCKILHKSNPGVPFIVHNAARFSSEEEATTTLFGVATRVFSNVSARPGLIEEANGGMLFLDEVHNLPERIQRTLLRTIEDGRAARIGETKTRPIQVQFVLASNVPPPDYGLAHDLLARLRVIKVPSLEERVADIPSIFNDILGMSIEKLSLDFSEVQSALKTDHYETLCLDGFRKDNIRGLIVIADKVATYMAAGMSPEKALSKVFIERFQENPVLQRLRGIKASRSKQITSKNSSSVRVDSEDADNNSDALAFSHYERNKAVILSVLKQVGGNVSATVRTLNENGIQCSRRWLDTYLDKWGVERRRYRTKE